MHRRPLRLKIKLRSVFGVAVYHAQTVFQPAAPVFEFLHGRAVEPVADCADKLAFVHQLAVDVQPAAVQTVHARPKAEPPHQAAEIVRLGRQTVGQRKAVAARKPVGQLHFRLPPIGFAAVLFFHPPAGFGGKHIGIQARLVRFDPFAGVIGQPVAALISGDVGDQIIISPAFPVEPGRINACRPAVDFAASGIVFGSVGRLEVAEHQPFVMYPFVAEPRPVEAAGKAPIAVAVPAYPVIAAAAGKFSADAFDPNVVVFLRRFVGVDFAHTLHQRFIGNRVQLIQRLAEKDAAARARRQG